MSTSAVLDQPVERLASLVVFQVDREAALVAIDDQEVAVLALESGQAAGPCGLRDPGSRS